MKKILLISLLSGLVLAGCSGKGKEKEATSSSDPSSSSSLVSSSSDPEETSKLREQFKDAMTNENANFPQLSTEVAEDEAEVKLITTEGDIRIKLFPKQAPLAVENFLTHAKEGYYDGVLFHRVINEFMIQTGDPKGDGTGGESIWKGKDKSKDSGNGFKNEYSPYLYNIRGALSMANAGPDTNGSQFFINQSKKDLSSQMSTDSFPDKIIEAYKNGGNPTLDGGAYTVFGQVLEGMDVVDKIAAAETDDNDKPKKDIKIEKIEIIKDYDFSK
ncbi:cyclophilin type peptidyl-prolyl cis-trans isomerase [Streptococcus sanguinis]|uniref:Peptidyl-prolyl cis-trans isomerase n=1 Tax=Streptococcus sanguinis TaxID=1305 RepID=A0AAJ5NGS9_STRSA|nr:peptidylprolyl isomerase [Streptococcus sanguinis]MCY7017474.1 peptidylprolyl isomerase [Streptococcus sanguinis]VDY70725.1 cyclophilin type peptidyl-prolyl cis-trans isomerase [Streptococcus sanguinis]